MDPLVQDIAAVPQVFVDDSMLAASTGLRRCVHQLTRHPEPLLRATEPWEGPFLQPVRVLREPETGTWRMWYSCHRPGRLQPGKPRETLHTARSEDGLTWTKAGTTCTFEDGQPVPGGRAIFRDPDETDPARLYKLIYYRASYYLAFSADGVHWRRAQTEPVWPNGAGDGLEETSFFMRDERLGRYRGYMRVWRRHQTIRKTSLGESENLIDWTGPKIIWEAQPYYGTGSQIYGMNVHVDAGLYWAFPWVFYTDEPLEPNLRQTMRLKLAWSRDGVDWNALAPQQDAVPMGAPGAFDCGMMLTLCPPVLHKREGRLYYTGADGRHDGSDTARCVGLARWRRGGLVSLRAEGEGALLTHRFLFRGEEIRINARTEPNGWVAAELLDDRGTAIDQFKLQHSDTFRGDDPDGALSWQGRSDLTPLLGQNLMLRLRLRKAEVFSFRIAGRPGRLKAPLGPPPVRCGRCTAPPAIDGVLDDSCWQDFTHSGVADDFVKFSEIAPALVRTRALLTRDEEHLYIAVQCEEPLTDRLTAKTTAGAVQYAQDDLVELRLNAPHHGTHVHQLMVTAGGRKQHCWFSKEEGGSRALDKAEWHAATRIGPSNWCIEMAVPFASLTSPPPRPGDQWSLNIIRYRHTDGNDTSCWRCMFGSVHRTDLMGTLTFT